MISILDHILLAGAFFVGGISLGLVIGLTILAAGGGKRL
jgi:hypothetical protein